MADAVELLDKDNTQTWLLRPSPRGPGQIVLTMQVGAVTSCWALSAGSACRRSREGLQAVCLAAAAHALRGQARSCSAM